MVEQHVIQCGPVTRQAGERGVRGLYSAVVGREQRESPVTSVECREEGNVGRLVRGHIVEAQSRVAQDGLEAGKGVVVGGNSDIKVLGHVQNMIDDVNGQIAVGSHVEDSRVVPLVENMGFVVRTN